MRKLTNYKWLNLFEQVYQGKSGKEYSWLLASRREIPAFPVKKADAVLIVPIIKESGQIALIEEWRHPLQSYCVSFPAGLVEEGENVADVVPRELYEETNLEVIEIIEISPVVASSAGMTDESVTTVFVYCKGNISAENSHDSEDIKVKLYDLNGIKELLKDDSKILCSKCWPVLRTMEILNKVDWPKV